MNFKPYSKTLSLLVGSAISINLCGCSNVKSSSDSDIFVTTSLITSSEMDSNATSSTVSSDEDMFTTEGTVSIYSESDNVVLNHFNELGGNIIDSYNSLDLFDKGKAYFIYCVDFLFYDGEIKGVKFSDLSDIARSQLINDIITIDDLICSKFPNYKSCIGDSVIAAYNKASLIIHSGSIKIDDYSREKLGEDNYIKIKEYKDLFVEQTNRDWNEFVFIVGQGYDKGKSKVKDWYEGFRSKNGQ